MDILLILSVIFIISFGLIFTFIYRENKKETGAEKMGLGGTIFVSSLLTLPILLLFGAILFFLLGSANTVNWLFALDIRTSTLVGYAFVLLVYLFTLDSIIEIIIRFIIPFKNIGYYLMVLASRGLAFYIIGLFFEFTDRISLSLALGIALIAVILEGVYDFSKKRKKPRDT